MSSNLKLGPNEPYRDAIEAAARETKLDPSALAALIDLEASKTHGKWDERSKNPNSSAQGLTQFVAKTWLDEATKPDRQLNRYAREHGLVDAHNHVVPGKTAELLELRNKPELSIMAAAQYAAANYRKLVRDGVFEAGAAPEQQARDLYTVHLLGPTGARQYADGTTTPAAAHQRLQQNGQNIEQALAKHGGNLPEAWHAFVDSRLDRIDVAKFQLPLQQAAQPPLTEMLR